MLNMTLDEFAHDLRRGVRANADANMDFLEAEFTQYVADELVDSGVTDGFEPCYYRPTTGGLRVDGYWFNESSLDLFITDFANREELQSLTQTEVNQIFKRVENFFTGSALKQLHRNLEETSDGYGLSRNIADKKDDLLKVNFYLLSERILSDRLKTLEDRLHQSWTFSYNVWDLSRLYRLYSSRGGREELEIDLAGMNGGLPCLPAHLPSSSYQSYLVVMPATTLVALYGEYGSRLLEQNVRSFLQIKGNVNKGIRTTILTDPEMFFAYNNGITATAKAVETKIINSQTVLTRLRDLQIVNGGQTTASLYHAQRRDKASLQNIFVQMKLSVVDEDKSEEVVPRISEYANTQNKVSAADFFANHPFHVRMEEFSRRLWAPAQSGSQRETKWFYERARGQYADAQSGFTSSEKNRFLMDYPKNQMFTKTDLAKFENVWVAPVQVNQGAQKNFAYYATSIGQDWEKSPDQFNEWYFKRAIARAIVFRKTERLVSAQSWYNGGYRANIVAYTIALLAKICAQQNSEFDSVNVWNRQDISESTAEAVAIAAKLVHDEIMQPRGNISNISEWCKKEACWALLQDRTDELLNQLPAGFFSELVDQDDIKEYSKAAVKKQKSQNGIEAQKAVFEIDGSKWAEILTEGQHKRLYSPKEVDLLRLASRMPETVPSEKQAVILLQILEKAKQEAIYHQ